MGQAQRKETSLASVLTRMLQAPDMWEGFADRYLDALDQAARGDAATPDRSRYGPGSNRKWERKRRAEALAEWHLALLDRLDGPESGDRLDRLVTHPALEGPERKLLQARLTQQRGDRGAARDLVREVLEELPGHQEALGFAAETGAALPPAAARIAAERSEWKTTLSSSD